MAESRHERVGVGLGSRAGIRYGGVFGAKVAEVRRERVRVGLSSARAPGIRYGGVERQDPNHTLPLYIPDSNI